MADPSKPGVSFGITGIPAQNVEHRTKDIPFAPGMPLRRDINDLSQPKGPEPEKQWTLYVLALERFKNLPVDDKLSYFQVAGIHAFPQLTWDEGEPVKKSGVYMLLFEQLVWKNMKAIIDEWKLQGDEHAKWREAANTWRMPYWDWARKQVYAETFALPEVLTMSAVKIFPPTSKADLYPEKDAYPNPLYGFDNPEKYDDTEEPRPFGKMPEGEEKYSIRDRPKDENNPRPSRPANNQVLPWGLANSTGRWAIQIKPEKRYTGLDGVNNFMAANRFFGAETVGKNAPNWLKYNPGNLSDKVNRMMTKGFTATWGIFASTKWDRESRNPSSYLSLEAIHNTVHVSYSSFSDETKTKYAWQVFTGGSNFETGVGHMSDVPVAAFDPIFWLHHCQIDRLLAMWQSLNWNLWWDQAASQNPSSNPNLGKDKPIEADTTPFDDLKPFHKYDGKPDYWNSNDCRDWTKLGYQYDSLVPDAAAVMPNGDLDEQHYKTDLLAYVERTYPGAGLVVKKIRSPGTGIDAPDGLLEETGEPFPDYIINVVYDRYALGGISYSIKFWLGGPEDRNETHFVQENYIGEVFTFTGSFSETEGGCENCKLQAKNKVLSLSQVPITIPVFNHIYDEGKDHPVKDFNEVDEYLKLHLRWTFVQHGGHPLNENDFPATEISVWKGEGVPRYTKPEQKQEADMVSIATMAPNSLDTLPANPVAELSQKVINSPQSRALPPTYAQYEPIYDATDGKKWGLKRRLNHMKVVICSPTFLFFGPVPASFQRTSFLTFSFFYSTSILDVR
ncbi:hypothetical protein ACHAPT_009107 [Fusarium lateritium]